ncbi:hypothetical protein V5799_013273 [Amblyomma americanum]|uniref:TIR domain-containing protein n=1 Tax=Amblyomma americanum TaxID=6943 RepID=A0AAQ4E6H7_AMBAM
MRRLRTVLLRSTSLQTVPSALNKAVGLKYLYIYKNNIPALKGALNLPDLISLDMRFNNIMEVDERYFAGCRGLRHLLLSNNKIVHLAPNMFKQTKALRVLALDNNRIKVINSVFDNMRALKRLSLRQNMITDIEGLLKSYMPNTKNIDLRKNNIGVITEFASSNRRIKELLLSSNKITNIEPGAFRALEGLKLLDLSSNQISYLNESIFGANSSLEYLNLSQNRLTSVNGTFKNTRRIRDLNLSYNRITTITDAFTSLTSLKKLSLKYNLLTHVPDDTFNDNVELLQIDMDANNIQWIGRTTFQRLSTVTDFRVRNNNLISLNGSVRPLLSIKYFDAAFNEIGYLEKGEFERNKFLEFISLMGNNISNVEGAFTGAVSLKGLGLAGNHIERIRRGDFPQDMKATPQVILDHNPLLCDCRIAWLMRQDSEVRLARNPTCGNPPWLKGKSLNTLTKEDIISWEDGCPQACRCECREDSLGARSIAVNCSSAALKEVPKRFPRGMNELDLSDNLLEQLDSTLKMGAPQVQVLSFRDNRLSSLNLSAIPETVHSLDLRGNRLAKLPLVLVDALNLTSLWLSDNPFDCDCSDYPLRQWIEGRHHVITDASRITCAGSPDRLVWHRYFLTLEQEHLCPTPSSQYARYLLHALVVLVAFLALSAMYLYFERQLKEWLHSRGIFGCLQCLVEDVDAEQLFDVFLSFSSKDAAWVHEQILPKIETMGFSYCTYERNFKGGFLMHDIIREAVACSRRTLLILTKNFLESEWCRLEFRLAHQRTLQDNVNRLVVVLVDDTTTVTMDEDLQLYIRASNHLRWGEPNFWERLQHSFPKRQIRRKLIIEDRKHSGANNTACGDL